jgi:prepilin signal peptidase PulO-like enzyme (type II secretory pathway)
VTRRGIGLGDVRLAAWLGFVVAFAGGSASGALVAGYAWLAGSVVASLVELSCYVATGRYYRRFVVPFAPALCAGALVAITLSVSLRI